MAWVITDEVAGIKFDDSIEPETLLKENIVRYLEGSDWVNILTNIADPGSNFKAYSKTIAVADVTSIGGASVTNSQELVEALLAMSSSGTSTGGSSISASTTSVGSGDYLAKPSGTNADASVSYTSATTITVAGLSFTFTKHDIKWIKQIPLTGAVTYHTDPVKLSVSSGVITVTGATFAATDTFEVAFSGQVKGYDSGLDIQKVIPQANAKVTAWSEPYTEFTPADTNYDEGDILSTEDDESILLQFSKTASTADDTYVRVIGLDAFDATVDYQQSYISNPVAGETSVSLNVYVLPKDAMISEISIPTNGRKYIRIDMAKKTDTGTDSTITCNIVHIPRN